MPIQVRHTWRTRVREIAAAAITLAGGVVAATAGAPVLPRVVGGVTFVLGTYALLDALVLAASWRLAGAGLKIPTLVSRGREISGRSGLVVSASGSLVGALVVEGERGTRVLTVNPLVSPHDLRVWFAAIADRQAA